MNTCHRYVVIMSNKRQARCKSWYLCCNEDHNIQYQSQGPLDHDHSWMENHAIKWFFVQEWNRQKTVSVDPFISIIETMAFKNERWFHYSAYQNSLQSSRSSDLFFHDGGVQFSQFSLALAQALNQDEMDAQSEVYSSWADPVFQWHSAWPLSEADRLV